MKFYYSLILCLIPFFLFSQEIAPNRYKFLQGESQLNIGVGMINSSSYSFSLFGANGSGSPSPSINIAYDYAIKDFLSIGAFTNYYRVDAESEVSISSVENFLDEVINDPLCAANCILGIGLGSDCVCDATITERVNVFSIGGKLSLKRSFVPEIDTYVSTYLGYSFNRRKTITSSILDGVLSELDTEVEVPKIIYFGVVGARYYVTPEIAIFGEFGYSNVHLLQIGGSYRFL